jgi:poly [ADP-ribose] polymerase
MDHVIEAAKSGRAMCRTCRKKIDKGELRFGEAVENRFDPEGGMTQQWHHLLCAAKAIAEKVQPTLATFVGDVPNRDAIEQALAGKGGKGGKGGGGARRGGKPSFPYAELAPSGRSKCLECGEAIPKDSWRVAIEREIDTGSFTTTGAGYLHPACVDAHGEGLWEGIEENSGLDAQGLEALRAAKEG